MSTHVTVLEPQDRALQARCPHDKEVMYATFGPSPTLFCTECRKMVSVSHEPTTWQELATAMQQEAAA
jgi:hypothetical protein